jgi:Flp pilus assembly protein TadG
MTPRFDSLASGWRRLRRDRSGAAMYEMALVAPVFLALLFGILELGALAVQSVNFHNAVGSVSRRIRTGQVDGPFDANSFVAQLCSAMGESSADCAAQVSVRVQSYKDFGGAAADAQKLYAGAQKDGGVASKPVFNRGGASAVVLVTATYRWFLLVPFEEDAFLRSDATHVLVTDSLLFKSEPYAP